PASGSWLSFSPDGRRVTLTAPGTIGVWSMPGLEPIWTAPNASSVPGAARWSADSSTLIVSYEGAGAALLDARTGESLARITEGRSGAVASQINVLPSLRYRLLRSVRTWAISPLPRPDESSPAESLRRALAEGGFRMRGTELEDAAP